LIIIKNDINSIFPKIINKIINDFDVVNKSENEISLNPKRFELTVLVIVKIDSLKEFSKSRPPVVKILDKIKILIKKHINNKNEEFKLLLSILYSVFKIL